MKHIVLSGMNPSKAGWPEGDLTVTKCCGFASRSLGDPALTVIDGGAVFSDDRMYRYRLWRVLGKLHPPTGRHIEVARVDLVNVFAFVSTDPSGLLSALDPWGPDRARHVNDALDHADLLIAAWGSLPQRPLWLRSAAEMMLSQMRLRGDVYALGLTGDGSPAHPSRLPYCDKPVLYRERRRAA